MVATMVKLDWKQCSPAHVVQGVKGGRTPYGAIRGGNGSFLVIDEKAEIHLELEDQDGEIFRSQNIINDIRRIMGWSRITANRVCLLENIFSNAVFVVNEEGFIFNLEEILR